MDSIKFKELLLNTAVCAIACDGHVDDREIEALHKIEKNSPYFSSTDLSTNLKKSLDSCSKDLNLFMKELFDNIDNNKLNTVQELTLLEISLRIIAADEIEEEIEKKFINSLYSHLKVEDYIITQRFGEIPYLRSSHSEFNNSDDGDDFEVTEEKK